MAIYKGLYKGLFGGCVWGGFVVEVCRLHGRQFLFAGFCRWGFVGDFPREGGRFGGVVCGAVVGLLAFSARCCGR